MLVENDFSRAREEMFTPQDRNSTAMNNRNTIRILTHLQKVRKTQILMYDCRREET